jgi:BirA family biotin operon repressor/biotin-[acetyl-CoA-carboxylase] ligase
VTRPDDVAVGSPWLRPFDGLVRRLDEVTSTNDVAAGLARAGVPAWTTVVASSQTAGRGRHGRLWFSPRGAGLYVSVVLRPSHLARQAGGPVPAPWPLLPLAAGLALGTALEKLGVATELKWPNDLVTRRAGSGPAGRKIGGILVEGHGWGTPTAFVVLGYGINLRRVPCPPELEGRVSSVEEEACARADADIVLDLTLSELARSMRRLDAGEEHGLIREWEGRSPSCRGSLVEWTADRIVRRGITMGIDTDGALLVGDGTLTARVVAGPLTWL